MHGSHPALGWQILRIWQPDERTIRMRWKLHGVPRIPWEVEGIFEGISNFKLDKWVTCYSRQTSPRGQGWAHFNNPVMLGPT